MTGHWQTWGQSFGRISRVGESNGLPGYKATSGGFVLGADWVSNSNWILGGAFGYARTTTNSFDTSATTNTYAGALYASWMPGAFVFDGRIAAGPAMTNTTRSIVFPGENVTATAGIRGWGGLVAGEAGYRFNLADLTLKPYVGLNAQVFRQASFTESSDVGLAFPKQTFRKLTSAVGMWASTTIQSQGITYMPQARVAWTRDLRDDALTSQAALLEETFAINAAEPGRDAALVSVNLAAWRTQMLSVYAGYTGEFRTNAASHQIAGGLRAAW
jgi:outer membrane autotransporter protein